MMVYLRLYALSLDESLKFYIDALGIFKKVVGYRIRCTINEGLMIDLDDRKEVVGISSFMFSTKESVEELNNRLLDKETVTEYKCNIAGSFLTITDVVGNIITICEEVGGDK